MSDSKDQDLHRGDRDHQSSKHSSGSQRSHHSHPRSSHRSGEERHRSRHSHRSDRDKGDDHRSRSDRHSGIHRGISTEHRRDRDRDHYHHSSSHRHRERSPHRASQHSPESNGRVTQTQLNELQAKVLKARLKKDPVLSELEKKYAELQRKHQQENSETYHNDRATLTGISKKAFAVEGTKNEDEMTAEELLREEKVSGNMNRSAIDSIIKDKRFSDDLVYQDDNSSKLAKHVQKGAVDLRKMETHEAKKLSDALDRCQLCIENDNICADMLSMAKNVYLTLPPSPEIAKYSAMIVPINHVKNTLYCDEDEWEEIRNYMISLSRFYYEKLNKAVVFYETSIYKYNHAAIVAVPIPMSLSSTIQGYFKESIISQTSDFEQQHKSIVDTLAKSEVMGRDSFKHLIAKEAPFFHVWFTLNGGLGHVVEDVSSWPKGDLFAREVLGGLLKVDPLTIRKQGRWEKDDPRVTEMSMIYKDYDWAEQMYN